jgi:hypothetical protein
MTQTDTRPMYLCQEYDERFTIRASTWEEAKDSAMGWGAYVIGVCNDIEAINRGDTNLKFTLI